MLVDCANGAASTVAPLVFAQLGIEHVITAAEPDGVNINDRCGSTHLDALASGVRAGGFDLGLAFDGDADRMLAVDADGTVVDGDQIIALLARDLQIAGRLAGDKVVVTSMSNLGFHRAMRDLGIETVVTDVGDRYVLAGMLEHGAVLGGEQSGHVIALDRQTTGDGLITAVLLLDALGSPPPAAGRGRDDRAAVPAGADQRARRPHAPRGLQPGLGGRRPRERPARRDRLGPHRPALLRAPSRWCA